MSVTPEQMRQLRDLEARAAEVKRRRAIQSTSDPLKDAVSASISGPIRGLGQMAATAALIPELGANALTRLAIPGERGLPLRTPVSSRILSATEAVADHLGPESDALPFRMIESAAELAGPGAVITHGLTRLGGRFLSRPRETLGLVKRMLAAAASNPQAAQRVELAISSIAGIGGEGAYESAIRGGATEQEAEAAKLTAEMILSVGTSVLQIGAQAGKSFVVNRVGEMLPGRLGAGTRDRLSREAVEDFFSDIFNEMGVDAVDSRVLQADVLENAIPGLKLNTAQVTQNPEIAAAQEFMDRAVQGGVTRRERIRGEQRQHIENFRQEIAPNDLESPAAAASRLQGVLARESDRLQLEVDDALNLAKIEADQARSGREIADIGLEARIKFDIVEEWFDDETALLYGKVADLPIGVPTSTRRGINLARSSRLEGNEWGGVPERVSNLAELNFLQGTQGTTVGKLQEMASLAKAEIRVARRNGDDDTVRRLAHIVSGIENDMAAAASRGGLSGQQAQALRQANDFYRQNIGIFREGQNRLAFSVDLQNADRVSPEALTGLYIRPNGNKNTLSSVADYRRILGDGAESRGLIRDTFSVMLRRAALPESAEAFNPGAAQRFVDRHSESLKAHGIWSSFDTPAKQAAQAQRVENLNVRSIKDIENSILSRVLRSNNPQGEVVSALRTGNIKQIADQVAGTGNPAAQRAFKSMVWDALGQTEVMGNPRQMVSMLENPANRHSLIGALGIDHYRSLRQVANGLSTIDVEAAGSAGATMLSREASKVPGALESKIVFAVRRMMQGFVSRQFTVVEIGRFLAEGAKGPQLRAMFNAALDDPKVALEMARQSRSREGKRALYSLWSSAFAAPAVQGGAAFSEPPQETQ